jgi:Bacterial protein of unknown function (DUF899)
MPCGHPAQPGRGEKAHTREGDAIAAARRRLPMVEVDATIPLTGEQGPVPLLEVFEGRRNRLDRNCIPTGPEPPMTGRNRICISAYFHIVSFIPFR